MQASQPTPYSTRPRRLLRLPSPLAFVLAAACVPAVRMPSPLPLASVPIHCERNLILVPVSVEGSEPFHVVLDTGMPTPGLLLFGSERVEALGLEFDDGAEVSGGGGTGAGNRTRVASGASIAVGGLPLDGVRVITMPPRPGFPPGHEGVIGFELFQRFAVHVDVDAGRLTLLDPATFAPDAGSLVVPLHVRGGTPFLDARVAVGDGEPLAAELAIDSGATHALWLNSGGQGGLRAPTVALTTRLGLGLSGAIEGRVGRVRRLELGDLVLDQVVALFPEEQHQKPAGVDFRDGFVGGGTLTRFQFTLDYAGSRLLLVPGARSHEPFEYDMTGLVLQPGGGERRTVDAVLADSPAAQAGILAGDILVAIDGQPLGALGLDAIARAFRVEGAELRLTLERGAESRDVRLRLRRLI